MVVALGKTITVIDRSGKVVSNSKHLVNVFKEAKSAYLERKAELSSTYHADKEQKRARKALDRLVIDDAASNTSSRKSSRTKGHGGSPTKGRSHGKTDRPPLQRGFTEGFADTADAGHRHARLASRSFDLDDAEDSSDGLRYGELARRHSEGVVLHNRAAENSSSNSDSNIDMDLAYGELPPPSPNSKHDRENEAREKMSALTRMLQEANCLQHSVSATIENLQRDPDALAAVALTLAEISSLVGKMSPGALMGLKGSFPAVMALLASPQFMIAAGVGVGVTVIAFGGYKIIKKIKRERMEKAAMERPYDGGPMPTYRHPSDPAANGSSSDPPELKDISDPIHLDAIEVWRRGIADVNADSVGTSVDGELITPGAEARLIDEGVLNDGDAKSTKKHDGDKKSRKKKKKHHRSSGTAATNTAKSEASAKTSRHGGNREHVKVPKSPKRTKSGLSALFA